jgi:hypothetical protein
MTIAGPVDELSLVKRAGSTKRLPVPTNVTRFAREISPG